MNLHEVFEKHVSIWHERTHYPYQDLITRSILEGIEASLRGEAVTIPIEVPRQSGKTTSIVDIAEFLLVAYRHYFGKPIAIGIFAPQREQATTDFDRLKTQYAEIAPHRPT
jgi:phage terminase large subunit-like protein